MSTDPFRRLIEKWREFAAKKIGYVVVEGYESPCVTLAKCADELEAALAPLSGPVDASGEPLKMANVRVGMRLREPRNEFMPLLTVTEITDKGFKYVLDEPYSYGSRLGVSTGGEHYGMDGVCLYELVDAAAVPSSPAQELAQILSIANQALSDAPARTMADTGALVEIATIAEAALKARR